MGDDNIPPKNSATGGCSLGCASIFVLVGVIWPFLHAIGGGLNEDVMMMPVLIGGPAFLIGHVLALVALRSKSLEAAAKGRSALRFMWGAVVVMLFLALVVWVVNVIRSK